MLDRVLLTNDDGVEAPGLSVLEEIAAGLAREVWVVAPEHDQSGQSHAISLHHPIRVTERGARRFGVTGTPGDCAVMGVRYLLPEPPALILSGVNRGANLGMETVFSGTVGGAMTGMMLGIPSIALSQAWTDRGGGSLGHRPAPRAESGAALAGDRLERGHLPQRQFPGPPGGRRRRTHLGAAGSRDDPLDRRRDTDRSARLHLSLAHLPSGPARAGTGE